MSKTPFRRPAHFEALAAATVVVFAVAAGTFSVRASAHGFGSPITWNREISRIVYTRCASCHRPGGTAFSLMTYGDAQPRANQIKEAVLARRMPPWGAIKGFGQFRNDQSLTPEQIELITKWVDGGIRRGNNPRLLPKEPVFENSADAPVPKNVLRVQGAFTLPRDIVLDGLQPESVQPAQSMRIVAVSPQGSLEPLVWLHEYKGKYAHPFMFRRPLRLSAGTQIQGIPADASILLIPLTQ
jgi:mono/diheme cytochrome c family protein